MISSKQKIVYDVALSLHFLLLYFISEYVTDIQPKDLD